jgi:hypothetical protein
VPEARVNFTSLSGREFSRSFNPDHSLSGVSLLLRVSSQ